ncbi:MAG: molybdopterin molybdotransferase MoeA [Desulforhopalus sp.]|nr:molybdopterin molybdotransferase MoeA [Desulforhopalus sp.]
MTGFALNGIHVPFTIDVLGSERVDVTAAVGRIAAADIAALSACPPHSESLRDGYVLASPGIERDGGYFYPVVGEIAAGTRSVPFLTAGNACRIFTGGMIPEGGERVVVQEECREEGQGVWVAADAQRRERLFINMAGSEIPCGEVVVAQGTRLEVDHLALFASAGVYQVPVIRRPKVACFCTGSELVAVGGRLETGQKLSLNSLLLQNLVPCYGGVICEQGLISDNHQAIAKIFGTLTDGHCDLVVSTGGMGPGKYDLVKNAFCAAGGTVILEALPMHPGRSILLGTLAGTVFIALPGPPNAVRTLINEFVGPVLLMMQGAKRCWPLAVQARLLHDYWVRESDLLQVRGGVLTMDGGCAVRIAGRLDPTSCFILFAAGRRDFAKGELVQVHLSPTSIDGLLFHL